MADRQRLDQYLAEHGYANSRSRARDMVLRGCVSVNGSPARKHSQSVGLGDTIDVTDPAQSYVSRAAVKLKSGLEKAGLNVAGQCVIDLGASTGGFTQVLLEQGAAKIFAIDVGHGQMAEKIAQDPRVENLEKTNARDLTLAHLNNQQSDLIVSDMSFVSLTLAAEPALLLAKEKADAILLVKPQFEVGKDALGKGGLVKDSAKIEETLDKVADWFNGLPGWHVQSLSPSPLLGGDGNREFLLHGRRNL